MSILKGIRVIEMAGLAPAPFAGMVLSDFGADVIRVDKVTPSLHDSLGRGKKSIALNVKHKDGVEVVRKLCQRADVLIDPFRRGVMEKLGLGPNVLMKDNPRLVYSRMTGYGQSGSYADAAGHDINYLSLSGVLSRFGRKNEKPFPPINLLGDFAGGGLICAFGITLALLERERSGLGQVIDANMVEGSAYVGSFLWSTRQAFFNEARGTNLLDGGSHFYETYKTKDNKYVSVGALEPHFYKQLLKGLGLTEEELPQDIDHDKGVAKLTAIFSTKTRDDWMEIFKDSDACVAPILELTEAPSHPHNAERGSFFNDGDGNDLPRPAPYLYRTPAQPKIGLPTIGQHTVEILKELGYSEQQIDSLTKNTVVAKL
ncbi:hypothetical protein CHUAL_000609 [Chamberlinius hualienensis]